MKNAVLYIRVSTAEQAREGVSLEAQEERLLAYCKLMGLDPVVLIREEGVSGGKALVTRPGGSELADLISKKKAGHVIALKLDRLFRDAEDALHQTKAWDKAGITLHLVDMGGQSLNTSSAMGRMMLTMMAGFAEMERSLIAERTEQALQHKKKHREAYSPTPYGFDREGDLLKENHTEQATVRQIKSWRADNWSLRKIAEALNEKAVATKNGGRWFASTVKYILDNNLYERRVA